MNEIKKAIRQINAGMINLEKKNKTLSFISINDVLSQQTILINMGMMYRRAGERVIIVDTDFDNTNFNSTLKLKSKYGLSDYLQSSLLKLDEIILNENSQKIDVILPGSSDGTAYLIGDPRFDLLMDQLESRYDRILINTPVFKKIDSIDNLLKISDGFIIVNTLNVTRKKELIKLIQMFEKDKEKILGYINVKKD